MTVDLEADLNAGDHTGLCWSFLDEASDPRLIVPGALIVAGDDDAAVVAEVVELEEIDTGTIVRFQMFAWNDRAVRGPRRAPSSERLIVASKT